MHEIFLLTKYLLLPLLIVLVAARFSRTVEQFLSSRTGARACRLAAIGLGVLLTVLSLVRYLTLHAGFFDLGVYDQKVFLASQGRWSAVVHGHWTPLLALAVLPYSVYSSAVVLILLQSAALALACVALRRLGRRILAADGPVDMMVLCFVLHPAIHYAWLFDFHPDAFYPLLVFLVFLSAEAGDKGRCLLSGLLAMGVKEPLTISTGLLGVAVAARKSLRLVGWGLAGIAVLVFAAYAVWGGPGVGTATQALVGYLGEPPAERGVGAVVQPSRWLGVALGAERWFYVYLLGAPLAFVFLKSPRTLLPCIPIVFISLFAVEPFYSNIHNHYALGIIPFLFAAALYGLKKRGAGRTGQVVLALILPLSLYFSMAIGALPYSATFWAGNGPFNVADYIRPGNHAQIMEAAALIPPQAPLTFQSNLYLSAFIHRPQSWTFPDGVGQAAYVLLDRHRAHFVWDWEGDRIYEQFRRSLEIRYLKIYDQAGVEVYHRK